MKQTKNNKIAQLKELAKTSVINTAPLSMRRMNTKTDGVWVQSGCLQPRLRFQLSQLWAEPPLNAGSSFCYFHNVSWTVNKKNCFEYFSSSFDLNAIRYIAGIRPGFDLKVTDLVVYFISPNMF